MRKVECLLAAGLLFAAGVCRGDVGVGKARLTLDTMDYTLTVNSVLGSPMPGAGAHAGYCWQAAVTCRVNAMVWTPGTQSVCMGWVGTGSVPGSGAATNLTFTMTNDSTLVWTWKTSYWGTWQVAGGVGSVNTGGWFVAGSNVAVTATASNGWHFVNWAGDTNACVMIGNVITVRMSQARSLVAVFAEDRASNGTPWAWLLAYGLTNGTFDAAEQADSDGDGLRNWKEWVAGTDPTNAGSVVAISPLEIDYEAGTIVVNWSAGTSLWSIVERYEGSDWSAQSRWVSICSNSPGGEAGGRFVDNAGTNEWIFYRIRTRK